MKQAVLSDTVSVFNKATLNKILVIEKDIVALKLSVLKKLSPSEKKLVKLRGILPSIEVTDEDIDVVKASLYSKMGI